MLSVNAAAHIGLDYHDFPVCKGYGSGLGGNYEARLINCPVKFVFGKDTSDPYTVPYDNGLQISMPSSKLSMEEQIKQNNTIPSLLGTDILLKHFETFISKDKIELTPLK